MTDILLSKPQLDASWIDMSVGEAKLIRNNLFKYFPSLYDSAPLTMDRGLSIQDFDYPEPAGYRPLVQLLEAKHQAPVVIGNGAKQLLGAVFHALRHHFHAEWLWLQPIFWALLPALSNAHGLDVEYAAPTNTQLLKQKTHTGYLLLAPNNPDNAIPSYQELLALQDWFKGYTIPLIHDGAYFTRSYLPEDYQLGPVGDVQIFSFSKMIGLSSLRGGYAVCYNKAFYRPLVEYMEMMTVGVSILTQKYLHCVMQKMKDNPDTTKIFERANYAELTEAKQILKQVSPKILTVPDDIDQMPGMFGWIRLLDREAFVKAKINIVGGEHFGDASKVRLNLGIGNDVLKECVKRLNEVVS